MKNVFNMLLLFGLTIGTASTVVSCKDYDDDITSLQGKIDANSAALNSTKAALESEIANLKTQLESTKGDLTTLINKAQAAAEAAQSAADKAQGTADAANAAAATVSNNLAAEILRAEGAEAALEARIEAAEKALADLNTVIAGKVDKDVYDAEVKKIYGEIAAVDAKVAENLEAIKGLSQALLDETTARLALAADVAEQKSAIEKLEGKLNTLDGTVQELVSKVTANADAIKANADAIKTLQSGLKTAQDDIKTIKDQITDLEGKVKDNTTAISDLKDAVKSLNEDLASVKKTAEDAASDAAKAKTAADEAKTAVATLNVFVQQALRSLVFVPDYYYWGIEATTINTMEYGYWLDLPAAKDNVEEESASFPECELYNYIDANGKYTYLTTTKSNTGEDFTVLDFSATYHLNPSIADVEGMTVKALSDDKRFTRAAACGISVDESKGEAGKGYDVAGGDMTVYFNVENPAQVKKIAETGSNSFVTVLATEATIPNNGKEATITSDYAAVRVAAIDNGVNLALVPAAKYTNKEGMADDHITGVINVTACGDCDIDALETNDHLFKTAYEAGKKAYDYDGNGEILKNAAGDVLYPDYLPQVKVYWNETLDLRSLIQIHYSEAGVEKNVGNPEEVQKWLTAKDYSVKFELTGLKLGNNSTSESVHAAINPADGYTFNPQMPEAGVAGMGKAQAYNESLQAKTTIGKRPLVRVKLIDNKTNRILDYGYINIVISDYNAIPVVKPQTVKDTYEFPACPVTKDCCSTTYNAYKGSINWIQFEYDIYHYIGNYVGQPGMSKETFEANYNLDANYAGYPDRATGYAGSAQYAYNETTKKWVAVDAADACGIIEITPNLEGQTTYTLYWEISSADVEKYLVNKSEVVRAIKFTSKTNAYPDVYVPFKVKADLTTKANPTVTLDIPGDDKVDEYWYTANTANAGYDEIHINVISVDDDTKRADLGEDIAYTFEQSIKSVFVGNNILKTIKKSIQLNDPTGKFTINDATGKTTLGYEIVFSKDNIGKEFVGASGKTYVMNIKDADDHKVLYAYDKADATKTEQVIAYVKVEIPAGITPSAAEMINYTVVRYNHPDASSMDNNGTLTAADVRTDDVHPDDLYTTKYAYDLLNAKAHNDLEGAINAILAIRTEICCDQFPELWKMNCRFLRPLNIKSTGKTIKDAAKTEQKIQIKDILTFTDWRDLWNDNAKYWMYYNIKNITVAGAQDGKSINNLITTSMNGSNFTKKQSEITNDVEFIYYAPATAPTAGTPAADYGYILYNNNSTTVQDFEVHVPITVTYWWGELTDKEVSIKVSRTQGNVQEQR